MRLVVAAVGRLRGGPEAALVADYRARFGRLGQGIGLGPLDIAEIDDRKARGPTAEAAAIARALPAGPLCALDERGVALSSAGFAALLARWRDAGQGTAGFAIGGADGLDPAITDRADTLLSLGPMVWPHRLVRAMLCEQLYRAATILAGTPYHRD
jgi:23S rRNA (pseudouridine1915-N3)-methyltransferase